MPKRTTALDTINARILFVLLILFIVITIVIGIVNNRNIQSLYEESYTERLLLTNALMGSIIQSEDIEYFVDLLKAQDEDFKRRQVKFYHDRAELFRLQEEGAPLEEQQAILHRLAAFHAQTQAFKNETYWRVLEEIKRLKEISNSTYVYVMADIGLTTNDGEPLFTYIFDAEDQGEYSAPDMDGLGTSDTGNEAFTNVFTTKKQIETAELYDGDLGKLYFVCVPLLNEQGEVIAVLGTDLSLENMNRAIAESTVLFNSVIMVIFIASVVVIYLVLRQRIAKPLSSLTQTALAFAEGNLHTPISESALGERTEIGALALAFKNTLHATTLYLNSIPESLFIMNRDCETYFRNEQFTHRFGDMQALEFMGALFPENREQMLRDALGRENNSATVWIDGFCFSVMLREIALADMAENSILVIANDITDLVRETENAQAAAAAKSNFLSRMSHEMRTPMNAIIGMTKVADGSDDITSVKHCLSIIQASSEQLLSIINDVLDMSKIEAGKFELENTPTNLEKTLMKVCSIIVGASEKKDQKFHVMLGEDLKPEYMADGLRLSQVLTNLLSNAVKFTPEGGTVTLAVECACEDADRACLRFCIRDTGIGMTAEQISRLFNAFEQADGSITRKFGGTGLGLAISQSIVEKMGGRIQVASEPGSGSEFSFTVPLVCIPDQDAPARSDMGLADVRVLIAEEDEDVAERLLSILRSQGVEADAAKSAQDALALLQKRAYDVVFLDYDLTQAVDPDKGAAVLITTYRQWHQMGQDARAHGIARHITKPIFPSSVADAINDILGQERQSPEENTEEADGPPDLSGIRILLAEDIEINREIFIALMDGTNIAIDIAENGLEAVSKFKENPDAFDMIIMDIQMPVMDGYEATRTIRAMRGIPAAHRIPIVAMSANAFMEDIRLCFDCGMDGHLAKPIDIDQVFKVIQQYT